MKKEHSEENLFLSIDMQKQMLFPKSSLILHIIFVNSKFTISEFLNSVILNPKIIFSTFGMKIKDIMVPMNPLP